MNSAFFASVRNALYGGAMNQTQVDSLNAIGQAWEQYGDSDPRKLAYILATAHHETGAFKWMREIWGPTAAQNRYEGRADLGNVQAGDGKKFMGRGFVQLTGRRNYQDWSKRTGLDLIKEPQLVQEPSVAALNLTVRIDANLSAAYVFTDSGVILSGTNPITWAVGDQLWMHFEYETA